MNVQRIARQFGASMTSQGVILLQQLILPPIFLRRYGIVGYGEWVALSASVAYLSTLQFGMQTYVNNELTMRYSRGEMEGYQHLQSTALRMLLGIAVAATALLTMVFALPVNHWLNLTLSQRAASAAVFFLGLQVIANLPLNYFAGTFMVFGRSHRGTMWQNTLRAMMVAVAAVMAGLGVSFPWIAFAQAAMVLVYTAILLLDLKRLAPDIFPTLRYWDRSLVTVILKPSGYFALILSLTFVVYQLPILIIQRVLGPASVVLFTVMRTLFSMARQLLLTFTSSLGPEVTLLYGRRDWRSLATLYGMSERILFTAIPVLNFAVLLAAPVLLQLWLHKPWLYQLPLYLLMAVTSCAISIREHKFQFQIATNTHRDTARNGFACYALMVAVSPFLIRSFGLAGFLWAWFAAETVQAMYVLYLNSKLFGAHGGVERAPVLRLFAVLPVTAAAAFACARWLAGRSLLWDGAGAAAFALVTLVACAQVFGLREVLRRWMARGTRASHD